MEPTRLTPRQRQVLDLLAKRYSNQRIADELGISLEGAKWHVREVLSVLGVSSREEAAERWRVENGLPRRLWRMTWGAGTVVLALGGAAAAVLVAAVVFFVLLARNDGTQVAPESTATPAGGATAPATLRPDVLPPPSRVTGNDFVDLVTAHVEAHVDVDLADLAGQSLPCSADEFNTAPDCPVGTPAGTTVLSIITFQCEIEWSPLTPLTRILIAGDELTLHSVLAGGSPYTRPPAPDAAPDYWMLFTNSAPNLPPGYAIAVKDNKIVSWGRSCGSFERLEERLAAGSTGYLLAPP